MNEIDDTYKQEVEDLDNKFIENHNLGRTKNATISKYLANVKKSRNKFNKNYHKYNGKLKWKITHPKKKKKKREKQKYLTIKHFNFEHNFFNKITMRLNLIFFNIGRFFSKTFAILTPRIMIYVFYKIAKTTRALFRDIGNFTDKKKIRLAANIKNLFKKLIENIKKKMTKLKESMSKIMSKFSKKEKKDDKDEKEENDDKGKDDKKDEKS